jgi:tRNA threonylcarbamoyladenosine biosynthesis protein TsaB
LSGSERILLAVDTSSATTSLAITGGEALLASRSFQHEDRRSQRLWTDIEALLAETGIALPEVEAFAVCLGPGGFTGLRVGIAAVEGLALASRRPAIGVTSLEAAAFGARRNHPDAGLVCAVVGAYKREVYSQLFEFDDRSVPIARNKPLVSPSDEAVARVAGIEPLVFAGDAVGSLRELVLEIAAGGKNWTAASSEEPVAENIALMALRVEERWGEPLKPCYVRPAEAEVKLAMGLVGTRIKRTLKGES